MTVFARSRAMLGLLSVVVIAMIASLAIAAQRGVSGADWQSFGNDGTEQHYSPLDQVNLKTVGRLGLVWQYQLPPGNTTTAPVMAEGKLFVTSGHSHVRAFDAATGRLLWEFDSKAREKAGKLLRVGWGPKGLAYWNH
ncbi:MAG: hypothetical protein EOP61_15310, partial [Sphingomonadales bacterium]